MKKLPRLKLFLSILSLILLSELSGQINSNINAEEDTVKISALLCLTGSCANWGDASLKGARFAVKEINNAGGILGKKLELLVEDSNEDIPTTTISALRRILAKGTPSLILGPSWSPAGLAVAPILKSEKTIAISPSIGIREFNEASDNIFSLWPHDEISSRALARLAVAKGYKKIAIFSAEQPWTKIQTEAFSEELLSQGGEVVEKVEPLTTNLDLLVETQRLISAKPELIMFTCFSDQTSVAAKRIMEMGYKGEKFSILMDQRMITSADGALEDTIFAKYPEAKKEFVDNFRNEYKEELQTSADTAYDSIYLFADTAKQVNSLSFSSLKQALNKVRGYKGASGIINFDGKGGVVRAPEFYQVRNGRFVKYNH